ncbi:MAG TPA: hypothetical protein VFM18_17065 [Methanosarcina sp.]|nr:hypothetical protein [Methanosarcina sp.]
MFKTKYRVVQDKNSGKYFIKQRSISTAFIWVFVGVNPTSYDTLDAAKEALRVVRASQLKVVHEE